MPTGDSASNPPQAYSLGPIPITPRTADPLISSFPRSRSPSPERRPRSNNGDGTLNTKGSSTTAASVKSKSSQSSWARKAPSFTEARVATTTITAGGKTVGGGYDSPPLTSDLFSRHSASSRSEEAWLVQSRRLRWARLALSVLIMACAVGALGCSGAAYHAYRSTLLGPEWHLRLWPVDLDLRPALVVLGSAAVVGVASGLYLVLALWPSPHPHTTALARIFTLLLLLLVLPLSLVSTMLVPILQNQLQHESIQTFTCRLYRSAQNFNEDMADMGIPVPLGAGVGYPAGFKGVCRESEAGYGLMAAVLGLSLMGVGVVAWGFVAAGRVKKERKGRMEGKGLAVW
ncbi:uncharacterized protein AB675_2005 [Cyphellophora attinorum]|uniref:Uncharacterized protein n=1 Tax=Cyphellophora attinorum TaxID=1664694 RepID=A0A0N1HU69_9EURO|nr:uncharacterized protein AB675_2005 [Phialophora attinorum]KPI42843.1 hypothetical protein AB675_2005 [Phialophora attinorum]